MSPLEVASDLVAALATLERTPADALDLDAATAQAAATLALAEEQRTANLLALAALTTRTESAALLDVVRDRLGLPA